MKWRRLLAITMLLAAPLNATARLTDIAKDFVNRTTVFSATRVMAPPTASGSYLMSLYINQPTTVMGNITATLRWTDEQGPQSQSLALLNNGLPQGIAFPIRVVANTRVTVETKGIVGTSYDLLFVGLDSGSRRQGRPHSPAIIQICCSGPMPLIRTFNPSSRPPA